MGTSTAFSVKQGMQCRVCATERMEEVINLPKLPFTGIYVHEGAELHDFIEEGVDQSLCYCTHCGHAQLGSIIDPHLVYDYTYTHRGSKSPIATGGNRFFVSFIEKLFPGEHFETILDIGCNDGYLLSLLENKGKELYGIDPIWNGKTHKNTSKITFGGFFVEEVDFIEFCGKKPNLIVSAHTFEHIENPRSVLEKVIDQVDVGTKFVIEVPSFDTLVKNHRFDQVFHQHIQYFSVASMKTLVAEPAIPARKIRTA